MQKPKIKTLDSIQTVTESGYFIYPGRESTVTQSLYYPCLHTSWKQEWVQICVVLRWGPALALLFSVFPMCICILTVWGSPFAFCVIGCCVSSSSDTQLLVARAAHVGCLDSSLPSHFPITSVSKVSQLNNTAAPLLANGRECWHVVTCWTIQSFTGL